MNAFDLTQALKAKAREQGFSLVGVCEASPGPHLDFYTDWVSRGFGAEMSYLERQIPLKATLESVLPGVKSILAVGLNYNQPPLSGEGRPVISRYALGRDYHKVLKGKLNTLAKWLSTETGAECRPCVDSAPIFERDYANLAGLGWFGKNTCLINSREGSWFFIGLLLTGAELLPDKPAFGGCGNCRACIDACPTGAIVQINGRWQVDSRRCISYLSIEHVGEFSTEQAAMIGDRTFGCDICQEVCPFNEPRSSQPLRAVTTTEPDFLATRSFPSLVELAQISDHDWDGLTRGSATRRAGVEGIKRNARANLRNQAMADSAHASTMIEKSDA